MLNIGDEIFTKWRRRWVLWYLVFLLDKEAYSQCSLLRAQTKVITHIKIKGNENEKLIKDHHDPDAGADGISIGSGTGA